MCVCVCASVFVSCEHAISWRHNLSPVFTCCAPPSFAGWAQNVFHNVCIHVYTKICTMISTCMCYACSIVYTTFSHVLCTVLYTILCIIYYIILCVCAYVYNTGLIDTLGFWPTPLPPTFKNFQKCSFLPEINTMKIDIQT